MKILIAVEDSSCSERAVEFVTRMRWPAGSRMTVVTVEQPAATLTMNYPGALPMSTEELREQHLHHQSLVDRAQGILRAAGFSTEGKVVLGDAREGLMRVVQDQKADLLVMGSHGRGTLGRALLGSVSSYAVTHAPCSVLVVRAS